MVGATMTAEEQGLSYANDEERLSRAKEIASHPETIEKIGVDEWSVPSQSGFGRYRVWFVEREGRCTCPDYARRGASCKHIYAVLDLKLREAGQSLAAPERKARKQYRQHPSYTKGQTEEMRLVDSFLHDLLAEVDDFPRVPGARGPAPTPFRDDLYAAILKVYSGMSARRASGVLRNVADRGLLGKVPSHVVSSVLLNRPEATPVLYRLLSLSAAPLAGLEDGGAVAPDSTGIQTTQFGGWREEYHGEKCKKKWLKVHAIVGTKAHVVIDARVLDATSADSPQFVLLLPGTFEAGFRPAAALAEKGYLSCDNYTAATEMGLETFIPFK